jgi:hypothetical protein
MSLSYSSYGASTIADAYGARQPAATREPSPGAARSGVDRDEQLKALKDRIHSAVPDNPRLGDFSKEATSDEAHNELPAPEAESAGGFPLTYGSAADAFSATPTGEQHALLERLNYAIHLLESQQDRRTATVTEELLLYALLGMFIICVLDNFARVGKYVR